MKWLLLALFAAALIIMPAASQKVSAAKMVYTVKFNNNSGTSKSKTYTALTRNVTLNTTIKLPSVPKAVGYQNLGWTTQKGSTKVVYKAGASVKVTRDMNLYAVRRKSRYYTVSFYLGNGSSNSTYRKLQKKVEEGTYYTSHLWITGTGNIAFECSFTVPKGGSAKEAEEVIATLEARKEGEKYPAELIPVRLSEIYQINEGYEWVVSTVKQELKKDFQGVEEDLEKIQQVIDSGKISPKKKDEWLAIGITVCAILTNEVEGMEWKTLIDGNREVPVLEYQGRTIDPMKIAWSKVKAGQPCNIAEAYQSAIDHH